ncbi:MAG: response regulator [Chloroflexi bacterium]|nr:response regulator [Chloroflexota bacterium]
MATIMVVDDLVEITNLIGALLAMNGYEIIVGHNGQDGMALLETSAPPALIISNLRMPAMNGFSFLQAVKHDARWRSIPFILMTADDSAAVRQEALAQGADAVLGKPFQPGEILDLIWRLGIQPSDN